MLEVRIPKPEERKPRRVSIGVGDKKPAIEGTEAPAPAGVAASNGGSEQAES